MYIEECVEIVQNQIQEVKSIVVWGATETAAKLFQYAEHLVNTVKYIVDSNKAGSNFFGRKVSLPSELNWKKVDCVIIASFYYADEITRELKEKYEYTNKIILVNQGQITRPLNMYISQYDTFVPQEYKAKIEENIKYKDIHKNQRLFVLCNGPSVKKMKLEKLQNEISIAVSNFYLHPEYDVISPTYYCTPQFTYTDVFTKEVAKNWLTEICNKTGNVQYFFNTTEKKLIEENNIFENKKVNYVHFGKYLDGYDEVDLTKAILPVQSVPIMCLQIGLYMGFKEIYLIGTEHDYLLPDKTYDYFYERKDSLVGKTDSYVKENGEMTISLSKKCEIMQVLWKQYRKMRELAEKKNIKIYNATQGGILDVFERVDFDSLF